MFFTDYKDQHFSLVVEQEDEEERKKNLINKKEKPHAKNVIKVAGSHGHIYLNFKKSLLPYLAKKKGASKEIIVHVKRTPFKFLDFDSHAVNM